MQLQISLAQMDISLGMPEANIQVASAMIQQAAAVGSQLVVLPELFSTGYDLKNWPKHASPRSEGDFERMAELARQHRIAVGGSLLEADHGRAYNTFVLYGADGKLAGWYRKMHLFQLMDEHHWLAAGDGPVISRLHILGHSEPVLIGMAICYDLRFPELFRRYAMDGAQLILLPAEWPAARREHWQILVQARAVENQIFFAAVNRTGASKGEVFGGGSQVIGPWGDLLAAAGDEQQLLTTTLDLNSVTEIRRKIPVLADRRPGLYGVG